MINKSLSELALPITEEVYREMPVLSYSVLARYEKGGFAAIKHLYDKQEGEALTFGSVVDTIITEGMDRFKEKFAVSNFKVPSEALACITYQIMECNKEIETLQEVSDECILGICDTLSYCSKMTPSVRIQRVREGCTEFYNSLAACKNKKLISEETYNEALAVVGALRNNADSAKFLQKTDKEAGVEFLYQQKFATYLSNQSFKCMFDILIVNHAQKVILPIDLKTTSVPEYDFHKKYIENRYDIQSRLYYKILTKIISEDSYFKDFKVLPFRFLVINKDSLTPMIFQDEKCMVSGDFEMTFNSGYRKIFRDPVHIGLELQYYLDTNAKLPDDLDTSKPVKIYERISNTW